jgi:Beta-1,3-glucanase
MRSGDLWAMGVLAILTGCGSSGTGKASSHGAGGAGASSSSATATTAASSGGAGGAGTAGSGAGGSGGSTALDCATPPCINVTNDCPFPLWIHAVNNQMVTLTPDDAMLPAAPAPSRTRQYAVPASWPAGRVNAYWVDPDGPSPDPTAYDKVEMTIGGGTMNYDITYVDYAALPSRMEAVGPACLETSTFNPVVSCEQPVIGFIADCPSGLRSGQLCLSAGMFCSMSANAASAYCHALDAQIAACATQNPATCGLAAQLGNSTADAYSCSGYFDGQMPNGCTTPSTTCHVDGNEWCAALNRGMLAQPMSTDTTQYYQTAPYNTYAQWVHETCPGIYAFPYDDYPSGAGQGGFRSCTADRLDITFCPAN